MKKNTDAPAGRADNGQPVTDERIIRNIAIDKYKKSTSKKRVPAELCASLDDLRDAVFTGDTPEAKIAEGELSRRIGDYLRGVTRGRRRIFFGRFYYGETMAQIAEHLSISTATVGQEIAAIKRELREYLKGNGVNV